MPRAIINWQLLKQTMKEIKVDQDNFAQEVLESNIPVLVDFWAEWCGPCKIVGPILSELADTYDGKIKVAKLNVDENPDLVSRFNVQSIPTMKFFKDGQVAGDLVGAAPKNTIEDEIKKYL
ncbi:MAG TPA: thioredoxin [Patescibacteria group bacterium]|nr:thioredoxin [Patescibacteria group bacterium]